VTLYTLFVYSPGIELDITAVLPIVMIEVDCSDNRTTYRESSEEEKKAPLLGNELVPPIFVPEHFGKRKLL
jgi:hypothetical protein